MKWKNRLTNYNFWISIVSAVLLILQAFEINFDIAYINEIATAVLGLLVVIGIISDPTKSSESSTATSNATQSTSSEIKPAEELTGETTLTENAEEAPEDDTPDLDEQIIPIDAQNANNNADIQNDFKVLIAQIQHDLETMTNENLALFNAIKQATSDPATVATDSRPEQKLNPAQEFDTIQEPNPVINEATTQELDQTITAPTTQTSYNIVN